MPRRLSSGSSDLVGAVCSVTGTDTGCSSAGDGWFGRTIGPRVERHSGARPDRDGPPSRGCCLLHAVLVAGLRDGAGADVGGLREAVGDDLLDLVGGDP